MTSFWGISIAPEKSKKADIPEGCELNLTNVALSSGNHSSFYVEVNGENKVCVAVLDAKTCPQHCFSLKMDPGSSVKFSNIGDGELSLVGCQSIVDDDDEYDYDEEDDEEIPSDFDYEKEDEDEDEEEDEEEEEEEEESRHRHHHHHHHKKKKKNDDEAEARPKKKLRLVSDSSDSDDKQDNSQKERDMDDFCITTSEQMVSCETDPKEKDTSLEKLKNHLLKI